MVIAQLWEGDRPTPMQFTGSLPPLPQLGALYQRWQVLYDALYSSLSWRKVRQTRDSEISNIGIPHVGSSDFEIDEDDVTHVSQAEFVQVCQDLRTWMNTWLGSDSFQRIDRQIRTRLTPTDEIRLIVMADDLSLLRLPWCLWEFFEDYPKAEIALSVPEFARSTQAVPTPKRTVKILAILGDRHGIDIAKDQQLLQTLPQADLTFLVEPQAAELTQHLWQPGWDILFFAGHSSSQGKGRIQINPTESLTIDQLKYGLRTAIANGLKLAIFNSCDGLGLAQDLADLHLPQVIVMREPVPDRVAQEFLKHFLLAFSRGYPLYLSVKEAREKLQALEGEFPCATWLPIICQNPAEAPPIWQDWCGKPIASFRRPTRKMLTHLALSSLLSTGLVAIVRWLGILQPLELMAFDRLVQLRPTELTDTRLLVVTVTEKDIQAQGQEIRRGFLSDRTLQRLLDMLEQHKPAAIGLDLYQSAATPEVAKRLRQSDRLIAICKHPAKEEPTGVAPAAGSSPANLGFSDFVQDSDGVVRRHLLFMDVTPASLCTAPYAFSVQLAFRYLVPKGITPQFTPAQDLQLGNVVFQSLLPRSSGYQPVDARGSQVLLNYRSAPTPQAVAQTVTLTQLLTGQVNAAAIRNRIVLIGVASLNQGDYWRTPYGVEVPAQIPGVMIHAQMVSQILSAVLDRRPLLWVWAWWGDVLWIGGWSLFAGILGWQFHRSLLLGVAAVATGGLLIGVCFFGLLQGGWFPLVPALFSLLLTVAIVRSILVHLNDN